MYPKITCGATKIVAFLVPTTISELKKVSKEEVKETAGSRPASSKQIEKKQQHQIDADYTTEPTQHPRAQGTLMPCKEQLESLVHGTVTDDGLQAAGRNDQRSHPACALKQVQDERRNVAEAGDEGQQVQASGTGIDQCIMGDNGKHHEKHGKYQRDLELQRVTAVVFLDLTRHGRRTLLVQVPGHAGRHQRHGQQIGIDDSQRLPAEDADQDQKTQEHHADRHQHGSHILGRLFGRGGSALACQHGDGSRTAVQPADDAGHQNARLMEHVAAQQIREVGDARHDDGGQPDGIRRQMDAGNQIGLGQHWQDDAADGQKLGKRRHLVVLHALGQLGEGMLQLGEKQDRHHDHHVEPRRLGHHNRSQAVGDEGYDDGRHAEDVIACLLHVVVQRQQRAEHKAASHEQPVLLRVEDIEQIAQNADEGKRAVGTEERSLPFALQADSPL